MEINQAHKDRFETDAPEHLFEMMKLACPKKCNTIHARSCIEGVIEVIGQTKIEAKVPLFVKLRRE
jgi:hypothetical protein